MLQAHLKQLSFVYLIIYFSKVFGKLLYYFPEFKAEIYAQLKKLLTGKNYANE